MLPCERSLGAPRQHRTTTRDLVGGNLLTAAQTRRSPPNAARTGHDPTGGLHAGRWAVNVNIEDLRPDAHHIMPEATQVNPPAFPETQCCESSSLGGVGVVQAIVGLLEFDGWEVAIDLKQPAVVEPVDVVQGRSLDLALWRARGRQG